MLHQIFQAFFFFLYQINYLLILSSEFKWAHCIGKKSTLLGIPPFALISLTGSPLYKNFSVHNSLARKGLLSTLINPVKFIYFLEDDNLGIDFYETGKTAKRNTAKITV